MGYVKFDVEEGIRDALRANEAARKSPTFVNLWACMLEGRRTAVSDDTEEADEEEDSTEEEVIKAPTPRGSVARLGSHVVSPASTPSHAPANRAVARRRKSLASRSSANLRLAAQGVKEGTVSAVEKAQSGLSNAWILTAALVAAELGFVAYNAIPLHHVVRLSLPLAPLPANSRAEHRLSAPTPGSLAPPLPPSPLLSPSSQSSTTGLSFSPSSPTSSRLSSSRSSSPSSPPPPATPAQQGKASLRPTLRRSTSGDWRSSCWGSTSSRRRSTRRSGALSMSRCVSLFARCERELMSLA